MSILTRVSRLFKADMHGIIDAMEEPEAILRQAVREMEEEIAKSEAHIKRLGRQKERLEKTREDFNKELQELEQEIGFCLDENNEILAKSLIRKKLEVDQWLKEIAIQLCCVNDEIIVTSEELSERKDKLKSITDKQGVFAGRNINGWAKSLDRSRGAERCTTITQEEVELEFLHQMQRRAKNSESPLTGELK